MSVVGFDFGTTNSLIARIEGDRAICFLGEEERPIPSAAGYEGTRKILGREAKKHLIQAGLGVHGNIVRSPKRYLGEESISIGGIERDPVEVVADVVRHVCREGQRGERKLGDVASAVVTIPIDMDGRQRRALRDAFAAAGLRIAQFVHEPFAALYGFFRNGDLPAMLDRYDRKLMLVFDWGGGTLDLTLCRPTGDMVVQIMNDGTDEVGGDVFDETLKERLLQKVAIEKGLQDNIEIYPGAEERLLEACERAKIDLSTRSSARIYIGGFFRNTDEDDFDYVLSKSELEEVVQPLLEKGFRRIEKVLADADYAPQQVALCLATGGMSNMPAVRERLHALFGPLRVTIPDEAATLIAEGAAWIATDEAGLRLAKNVELELARSSYLPLVKAGTLMPREGEVQQHDQPFHLYCTDPRDGIAKFQICAPGRPGTTVRPNEPRIHLETMTVKVDAKAGVFKERLELDVRVDEDLILRAHARSMNKKDEDQCEIHNLEFGLHLPRTTSESVKNEDGDYRGRSEGRATPVGALSVRANVTDTKDLAKVPGEFLYAQMPEYFDTRLKPPEEQVLEKLYYTPCAVCGRASNDPGCTCASSPSDSRVPTRIQVRSETGQSGQRVDW